MFKRLLPLFIFVFPLALLGDDELPTEVKRPAVESYRHIRATPYITKPDGIQGDYRRITVSPKTFPDPLLRYRVNVFASEKETGNAYPLYLAAFKEISNQVDRTRAEFYRSEAYRKLDPAHEDDKQKIDGLLFKALPLYSHWSHDIWTEITSSDEDRIYTQLMTRVYPLLEKASKKTYLDWSDEYQFAGIATLLEPIQDARTITRYLVDKANWEIRNGNYEDAIRTIRVGLAHAEHILESRPSSFLVGMLVGTALKGAMYDQLLLLAAQPDAPNMYPALTQLSVSQTIWLDSLQAEVLFLIPKYGDDTLWDSLDNLSPKQAQTIIDELVMTFLVTTGSVIENEVKKGLLDSTRTVVCLATYPLAKKRLLQKGLSEQEIEVLSTYQVVAPFVLEELKRIYDLMFVEASMPSGESHTAFNLEEYVNRKTTQPFSLVDTLLGLFVPAVDMAQTTFHRQTQTLDLLKIVEALRYYAAVHDGQLPQSLEAITELAIPKICPITGKPYDYRIEGKTAIIDYEQGHGKSRLEIVIDD